MAAELTVRGLQKTIDDYVSERGWKRYHKPKDVAIAMAIESSELLELFQWMPDSEVMGKLDEGFKNRIGEELADTVIYAVCMANAIGLDFSGALLNKIEKNRLKYPLDKVSKARNWDEVRSLREKPLEETGDDID